MDRRQYLGLTGTSIVALLGGCFSSEDHNHERTTQTPSATATATVTATATETSTATATETPTEESTETATSTPEPENRSLQEVYDDAMADASAPSVPNELFDEERINSVDTENWSARDLERVAVAAAQRASKEYSAQNIAKTLYQTFSQDADELYADSRRALGRNIVKIFDQVNDEIHYLVPWASQTGEDDMLIEGEEADDKTERNLAGLEDPTDLANACLIDPQTLENAIEYSKEERNATDAEIRGALPGWINAYDDLLPGPKYDTQNLTFTEEAGRHVAQQEVHGYGGIDHIKTVTETMEATKSGDDETVKFYMEGGGLSAEVITGYDPEQGFADP